MPIENGGLQGELVKGVLRTEKLEVKYLLNFDSENADKKETDN